LIRDDGHQYGVVSLSEARRISEEIGLDLVEIAPNANPPVVKLIDYGKFKYEAQKKANEAKKKTAQVQLKEIQFRPNIDVHDLGVKLKQAQKFLAQGDKIKMMMQFRGREMANKDIGLEKFDQILDQVREMGGVVEDKPKMMGNRIITLISPDKKQVQAYLKSLEEAKNKK